MLHHRFRTLRVLCLALPLLLAGCLEDEGEPLAEGEDSALSAPEDSAPADLGTGPAIPRAPALRPMARAEPPPPAPPPCTDCGTVASVRAYQVKGSGSGVGIAIGAVAGGLLGNQIGSGSGKKVATVAGAVGGGFAGNEIEKRRNSTTNYEVVVQMDSGGTVSLNYANPPGLAVGQKVRVSGGQAVPL